MEKTTWAVLFIKISFSLAAGQNYFLSNIRHSIEFAEFSVKLAFDLGEAQSRLLFAIKHTLKWVQWTHYSFIKFVSGGLCTNCTIKIDTCILFSFFFFVFIIIFLLFSNGVVAKILAKMEWQEFSLSKVASTMSLYHSHLTLLCCNSCMMPLETAESSWW